jgi:hypothetical protein
MATFVLTADHTDGQAVSAAARGLTVAIQQVDEEKVRAIKRGRSSSGDPWGVL